MKNSHYSTVNCLIMRSNYCVHAYKISQVIKKLNYIVLDMLLNVFLLPSTCYFSIFIYVTLHYVK